MPTPWTPDSWKAHEARHLPHYEDAAELAEAEKTTLLQTLEGETVPAAVIARLEQRMDG